MRINHNISALNTYRSLAANNSNTTKSLEKLSSGLRINRAGDDAAGLAISEKMRGQIRGLNQAERNSQDGISMLQTAEGALSEVHSILQRIKELATQASNGTNTDADRAEMQKEINQLTSEVNRIGNNTEFNTKKILNGGVATSLISVTATTPPDTDAAIGALSDISGTPGVADTPGGAGTAAEWSTGAIAALADDSSLTFTFNGVEVTVSTGGAADASSDFGAKTVTIGIANGATADGTAAAILAALEDYKTNANGGVNELESFTFGGDATGITIAGDAADGDDNNALTVSQAIALADAAVSAPGADEVPGTAAEWNTGAITAVADDDSGTFIFNGITVTVSTGGAAGASSDFGAKTVTIGIDNGGDADDTAAAIIAALQDYQTNANGGVNELDSFTFNGDGTGIIITGDAADGDDNNGLVLDAGSIVLDDPQLTQAGVDGTPAEAAEWTTGAVGALADNSSRTFSFNGVTVTVNTAADAAPTSFDFGGKTASITIENGADADEAAAAILAALEEYKTNANGGANELAGFTFGGDAAGITITGDAADGDDNNALTIGQTITLVDTAVGTPGVDAGPGTPGTQGTTAFTISTALGAGDTFEVAGQTITVYETDAELAAAGDAFGISLESDSTADDQAAAIRAMTFTGLETSGAGAVVTLSQTVNGTGDVTNAGAVSGTNDVPGVYTFSVTAAISAGASYNIDGNEILVIDAAEEGNYTAEIAAGTVMLAGADEAAHRTNLAAAINANAALSASYQAAVSGTDITLTQQTASETAPAPVVFTAPEAGATGNFTTSLQIGANQGQSFVISINDMRSQRLGLSGATAGSVAAGFEENVEGAVFSAGEANQLTDTSTAGTAEFALDVSNTTRASAAINVIDQAITTVSAERSRLGAYQNRLEHTINNLGTSAENLTAAESRIRDVDMAKEMMEFTKNNILAQAAQAMLAQANQQPQGVLQLLQ